MGRRIYPEQMKGYLFYFWISYTFDLQILEFIIKMKEESNASRLSRLLLILTLRFQLSLAQFPTCYVISCYQCTSYEYHCLTCQSSFSLAGPTCCSNSISNCASCAANSYACDSCSSSSFCLNGNTCSSCDQVLSQCTTCANCGTCLTCSTNSYAINAASQCQLCSQLMGQCSECSDRFTCSRCVNNSYAINSDSRCQLCTGLMSECSECSDRFTCSRCVNNSYAINTDSRCQLCTGLMSECSECSNRSTCTECVNSSYAINSTSYRCQSCVSFLDSCTNCNNATICIACQPTLDIVLSEGKCLYCIQIMPKCLSCTNKSYCTLCAPYYALVYTSSSTASCFACSLLMAGCFNCASTTNCLNCGLGYVVNKGCSLVPGCISVNQFPSLSICQYCDYPQFELQPMNGTCVCRIGHLAGRSCTEVIGCIVAVRNNTLENCLACNKSLFFHLRNRSCVCDDYFYLNGSTCVEVCGDGRLYALACDDGNLVDGDGCSSTCKVEPKYRCNRGQANSRSQCVYKGRMKMDLQCINNLGGNTASIVFSITPNIANFQKSNLTSLITFNTNAVNCSMTGYSITNSQLQVYIKFQSNVQGLKASLTLAYDQDYIASPQQTVSFLLVECHGDKLMYEFENLEKNNAFRTAIKAIGTLTWIAWLLGSYSHKMIGVETLHSIQLIFIMQVFSLRYYPIMAYFNDLDGVLNAFSNFFLSTFTVLSNQNYARLGYSAGLYQNSSVIVMLQFLSVLALCCLFVYEKKYLLEAATSEEANERVRNNKIKKIAKYRNLLYNFLVFPIVIGTYIHSITALVIHSNVALQKQAFYSSFKGFISVFMVVSTFLIYFKEWGDLIAGQMQPQQSPNIKKGYVPLYLTNLFFLTLICQLALSNILRDYGLYAFAAGQFLNALSILAYCPYSHPVDYVGVAINQIGVLLNAAWVLSSKYVYLSQQTDWLIAFIILAWMALILIWSFIRTFCSIKRKREMFSQNRNIKIKKVAKRVVEPENDQFVKAVLRENEGHMNQYNLSSQLIRRKDVQYEQLHRIVRQEYRATYWKRQQNRRRQNIRKQLRGQSMLKQIEY